MDKPKKPAKKEKYTTFGLSFPDERVLDSAKVKAKELGMSLSAYVNQLIRKDVGMSGAFTHEFRHTIPESVPPRDVSQTKSTHDKSSDSRLAPPLIYGKPTEALRFVAEEPKKKQRH